MTTVKDLPEEILLMIFSNLFSNEDLVQFQTVCRAWYHPAHIKLLNNVFLSSPFGVEQFIATIDHNPKTEYLKAVKSITPMTDEEYSPICHFTKDSIRKLFLRFPNLQEVWCYHFSSLLYEFDDDICDEFVKMYPKFKLFRVDPGYADAMEYSDLLYKLRRLVTYIDMNQLENVSEYGGIRNFLSSFPRLVEIEGYFDELDNFEQILPVFEKLPNFTWLALCGRDDQENFAETYLATRPKDVQDLVVERLSRITRLSWETFPGISVNAMNFVSKYLTGLEVFNLNSLYNVNWTELQQDIFRNNVMDLICSVKSVGSVRLNMMRITDMSRYLPTIASKLFHQTPCPVSKLLEISTSYKLEPVNLIDLYVWHTPKTREISVTFKFQLSLQEIAASLFNEGALDEVGELKVSLGEKGLIPETTLDMYNTVLASLPSVKTVTLDIPMGYKDNKPTSLQHNEHPQVETLALCIAPGIKIQTLLNTSYYSFPNMKHLRLYYYSGVWEQHFRRYQVRVPKHTLETLTIDITPIVIRMVKDRNKFVTMEDDFVLIKLKIFDTNELLTFMVSLDLKTVKDWRLEEMLKQSLYEGVHYHPIHITVKSLQRLKLCVLAGILNCGLNSRYDISNMRHATVYSKTL